MAMMGFTAPGTSIIIYFVALTIIYGAHHRVPNLQDGRDILEKKAGKEVLEQIDRQGEKLLSAILK